MSKNTGLGRGLSSLIPNKQVNAVGNQVSAPTNLSALSTGSSADRVDDYERVVELPVDKLVANPSQPRDDFNSEELDELKNSIREHGLIQPIIATKVSGGWQIIAGERRWRAVKALGQDKIPAIVRDADRQKRLEIALIENIQRKDLNALESAAAYKQLMDEFGLDQEGLSKKLGKNRSTVANTLRILTVIEPVKEAIRRGKITEGHARTMAGLPPAEQLALLNKVLDEKLNVREAEGASRKVVVNKHLRKLHVDPEVIAYTEELQKTLGTKVNIKKNGEAGQIVIKFFSDEEFGEIFKKING